MQLAIGIDTGGTYTDGVLINLGNNQILGASKTLTTRHDLSLCVKIIINNIIHIKNERFPDSEIETVGLSTTLATNALAENYGCRICLILIGYSRTLIEKNNFDKEWNADRIVYIQGGHDLHGDQANDLDLTAIKNAVIQNRNDVESFAISSYFATRNTTHEIIAKSIVEKYTNLPVTCGHELTARLNSIIRAKTVAINARLIPLLRELIQSVRNNLDQQKINAPLMIVKGDGTLINSDRGMRFPVETILSGPAASVIGAQTLSKMLNAWVIDVGGTTTDIGLIKNGKLITSNKGAVIENNRMMVEAIDIYTSGIGGDSHIMIDKNDKPAIGPQRVIPLCLLAEDFHYIFDILKKQKASHRRHSRVCEFAVFWRLPEYELSKEDHDFLLHLKEKPLPLIFGGIDDYWKYEKIKALEKLSLIQRAGFTPTDALHALGSLRLWNPTASFMAAEILSWRLKKSVQDFCEMVLRTVKKKIITAIVTKFIINKMGSVNWKNEKIGRLFLDCMMDEFPKDDAKITMKLKDPIVAIGAPAKYFMENVSNILNTQVLIPEHAEVANAIGAATGLIVKRQKALITLIEDGQRYRAHLPDGIKDFDELDNAVEFSRNAIESHLKLIAESEGAVNVKTQFIRSDRKYENIFLDTELTITAVGRPYRIA